MLVGHVVFLKVCVVFTFTLLAMAAGYTLFPQSAHAATGPQPIAPSTPAERCIIVNKETERPFSGALLQNKADGVYTCRQCGTPLFRSADKFESGTGWPSFDDAIPGAVRRVADVDGHRTEIVCAACGGHLGHVFEGERFTAKNTRHCVNSASLSFTPAAAETAAQATAYFAGGCFWGVEDAFEKVDGVQDAVSGYMGGSTANPSYDAVSTGKTGHAETVRVQYDPSKVSYETLARLFFELHDPTQKNRQGPDVGTQYRSAIFTTDAAQRETIERLVALLKNKGWNVATEVADAGTFYPAEDYHQDYTRRTGRGACHIKVPRFDVGPR